MVAPILPGWEDVIASCGDLSSIGQSPSEHEERAEKRKQREQGGDQELLRPIVVPLTSLRC